MAQQAQLLINSITILVSCLVVCCKQTTKQELVIPSISVNSNEKGFSRHKNVLTYLGKPFSGTVYELYQNKDTMSTCPYYEGQEHGYTKKWYPNKNLMEVRNYNRGNKTGQHKGWWENGNLKFQNNYTNDVFNGNVKEWSETGLLYKDSNYKNGHEYGTQKLWRSDGSLYANYVVRNGRNYGLTGVKNCKNVGDDVKKN